MSQGSEFEIWDVGCEVKGSCRKVEISCGAHASFILFSGVLR